MPLTRYQIRNEYGLADPELYGAADRDDPEALLEGVAMAGLVGVLRQLGDLAEFAAEIFHDLHEEVMATAARGHGLMVRVQQLEAEFPSIEKAFLSQTSHSLFFTNAGVDWHPNLRTDQNLITRGDLPRFVMDSYEECRGPPRLFLLDKFDVAGAGACLKRYTDPSFFKVEAASSVIAKVEVQREKKIRKVKKKGSRWKNGETPEVVPASHAKLHQLFLEEPIENGHNNPARLVKLKKRQLNGSPFDSKTGKSYMEKFLDPPSPEHKVVYETSYSPPRLKLTSDNTSESGEILEISTVSPVKKSPQRKESRGSSRNAENIILKQPVDELNEEAIDGGSSKVPGSNPDGGPDITPTLHEMSDDRVFAVVGESKSEGSVNGYNSDDVTSEIDNYVDALTTMESEMETDNEYRPKNDIGFLNMKKHGTDSDVNEEQLESQAQISDSQSFGNSCASDDGNSLFKKERSRNEEQLESQAQFSDSQSFGNSCASDDGNSLFKKERSSFSYSDTGSNLADTTPSDGDGVAKVFSSDSSTEARVAEIVDMPSDQLFINEEIPGTKSRELVVPNGTCIEETKVPDLGEVSCSSCLTDTSPVLLPLDPRSSSMIVSLVGQELDETSSDCIKLGTALSDTDDNGTYLGDNLRSPSVASDVPSQTRDNFLDPVSAESPPVHELDGGDPNVFSDALLHLSNVSVLAPEKKGSDNSVDEVPQTEYADDGYSKNLVDEKIGSPCSIISPAEEQQLSSTLPEVEACSGITLFADSSAASAACYPDVVKPECIVTEVDDAIPATGVDSESSTHLVDTPQIHSFLEQQFSDMTDDVTPLEHDSAKLGLPFFGEKTNCEGISRIVDGDEIGGFICNVDAVGGDAVPPELPSNHPNCLGNEDHVNLDDRVTETVQVEDVGLAGVASAAKDTDVDVNDVICSSPDLNGSPSRNLINLQESLSGFGDPHQKGLEFNATNSPEFSIESEAQEEVNQLSVAPADLESTRTKSVSCDHSNSEMLDVVHDSSVAEQTQNSLGLSNVTTAPTFSELNNQELESKSPHQSRLLENSEDAVSSPASCHPEPGNALEQALELQAGQLVVECLQGDGASNKLLDVQFEQMQSSNHMDQERRSDAPSESCPEELQSQPSSPEFSPQAGGQKFDGTERAMVSLNTITPSFALLPEATQVNLEEMPPLPPLPPMQWRIGKVQYAPPPTHRELVEELDSFPAIQPSIANEKAEYGIPASQRGSMPPQNPFLPLAAVENGKSQDIFEHFVGNSVPPSPISLQIPAMLNDANSLQSCLTLEKTQSLNPFLSLPETSNEGPEHGSHASEGEMVQSSLNPFSPAPAVEDTTSMHNLVSSQGKLIQPLNHLAPETGLEAKTLQHTSQNIEGERGNPPDASMPPDTREGEHTQHGLQTSDGETSWSSNTSALLQVFEVGKPNGNPAKLPRPRSPLIDAVAAHDKSKLRKVTERVRPQIEPKVDERDSLLEQIRTKSFNLKPAGVMRPSIQGPKTNLKVAAILEKAKTIRQAFAGSDEDDDADSWSDS